MANINLGHVPPADQLHDVLSYDTDLGELIWKRRSDRTAAWNSRYAGKAAGTRHSNGRQFVNLNGAIYPAHRLIWMMAYGSVPVEIDHINCRPDDNRLCNLRAATRVENARNRPVRRDSKAQAKGIYQAKSGRWCASIKEEGRKRHLGTFDTEDEAKAAFDGNAARLHGEFARLT